MRRIVMFNRVSADGYFAAPDGNLNWVVPEPEIDRTAAGSTPEFDTVLFGRRTFEMFSQFWPKVAVDEPTAPHPHDPGKRSPEMRAMAIALNQMTKLVFSTTLKTTTWQNSRIVRSIDAAEIAAMKKEPGKDMIVFGSGSVVAALTDAGLIDEYQFIVSPVLLGNGKAMLAGMKTPAKLTLVESRGYPLGNVTLRYAPSR